MTTVDGRRRPRVTLPKLSYIVLQIIDSSSESNPVPQLSHALRGSSSVQQQQQQQQ